ncbi:hypothetical protein [Kribbella sp.]|uniref:hypothetical protein n=1 Tax=Kribbella sp. TaxID=1871183 RepID=UPI002D71B2CD|nr:hypothetical protein [Kribbella sp.]HZX03844.1 hypothetical protein [Kribbella sp.]
MSTALIFPVGHYLGANHPGGEHLVRIGWRQCALGAGDELAVWALAHGVPGRSGEAPWTRTSIEAVAQAGGITRPAATIDQLLERDLLIEVTPGTADAVEFARACRIGSLLVGSGVQPNGDYGLGAVPANPSAGVDGFAYELWTWGHAFDSLWDACELFASTEADSGEASAQDVLDRVLPATQQLLAGGAAYLDESREPLPA